MSLILEGFMGSGKSAVGRVLASRLELPFVDTDTEIEKRQSCSIADIFDASGEEAFRQMETSMLQGLFLSDTEAVISLGGGTPVRAANVPVIKKLGRVVYLKASADTLIKRLEDGVEKRPMLIGHDLRDRVEELLDRREGRYIGLADIVIDIADEDISGICDMIIKESQRFREVC